MQPRIRLPLTLMLGTILSGCASHRPSASLAVAPRPPAAIEYAPRPAFASAGMTIPATLPDGSYPTPSAGLRGAAALWHLRAALNVAALSCPDSAIAAAYNDLLVHRRVALSGAQRGYAASFRAAPPSFDVAMTRLYNFYALFPARAGFCDAAGQVLAEIAPIADADLPGAAPGALAALDRPFTDFYRAYDAWRMHRPLPPTTVALVAPTSAVPASFPRIEIAGDLFAGQDQAIGHAADYSLARR